MLKKLLCALGIAASLATFSLTATAAYTSFYVFGDSLSDDGNVYLATGGAAPASPNAQRFSNGPVAAEYLGSNLGLPLTPSLLGGNDFAFGGAQTGFGNLNPLLNDTGVLGQIGMFQAGHPLGFSDSSLVMLWAGPNDIFSALALNLDIPDTINTALGNLGNAITQLYGLGARRILMPNMPNLGITPFGLGSGDPLGMTAISAGFNLGLSALIGGMEALFSGLDIIGFDTFSLLNDVAANPGDFGFTNVSSMCLVNGVACADPDSHLFWDSVHPTTAAHRMLGNALMTAVPEPGSMALLLAALFALTPMVRRARNRSR